MSATDRPKLRPYLDVVANADESQFILHDLLRLSQANLTLTPLGLRLVSLLDGSRTLRDVQTLAMRWLGGQMLPIVDLEQLVATLDEALFLDTPAFHLAATAPVRPPSCIGVYSDNADEVREQLTSLFRHPQGAGLPGPPRPDGRLRALLVPHIDYARGGLTYTFGFKELAERTDASLFVIIGTSHYSPARFTLTRKHFQTPLGVCPTDNAYINRLVEHYGDGLFDDELMAHLPEHSIELEVVFLQYLFEKKRDIRIVPLVVGSFRDSILHETQPTSFGEIQRMVDALQRVESETAEPICYVISGDLAHIGPKFEDEKSPRRRIPLDDETIAHSLVMDREILKQAEKASLAGFFEVIADERDERRICGLPPTWLTLAVTKPTSGRVLHYDQYVHPKRSESVSFASVVFDG